MRLGVYVGFDIEVRPVVDGPVSTLSVHLSAVPLSLKGDYRYSLQIDDFGKGISLAGVATAIRLTDAVSFLNKDVPLLGRILESVHVRHVSLGLVESADA